MSKPTKEELEFWLDQGLSQTQIAEQSEFTVTQINYGCRVYGLKTKWTHRNEYNRKLRVEGKKQCSKCDEIRSFNQFENDPRSTDGLSSQCKVCRNPYFKNWQTHNRDKTRAASQGWKKRNPDRVKAYSARYYADNKEEMRAKFKAYMTPERNSYYLRLRRDRKRGAKGRCTFVQLQARIDYYGGLCWICKAPMEAIDHVKPLAKGGTEWPANLRSICTSCNSVKRDIWPYETSTSTESRISSRSMSSLEKTISTGS